MKHVGFQPIKICTKIYREEIIENYPFSRNYVEERNYLYMFTTNMSYGGNEL